MSERTTDIVNWRALGWLGFYGLILLAWAATLRMALASGHGGHVGGFGVLFTMWALMMAAMMLPTIVPTLRAYDRLPAASGATRAGWWGLVAGYAAVWLLGSAAFAGAQVFLRQNGWVDMAGALRSPLASAGLLALAGAWQFTRSKQVCQDACLSPMGYFLTNWRPGAVGGARMGVDAGLVCVGCCWAIMALAFVGGVMNLWWMGLATLFMVAEKLPEIGAPLRRPAGAVLLLAALAVGARGLGWV